MNSYPDIESQFLRDAPDEVQSDTSGGPLIVSGRGVTAVLGPTNTGKTHYALERMVAYKSGVIGLPLRLLAREVYQKLVLRLGVSKVALVTGEEKINQSNARYTVCTVEAMPRSTSADFVAIDEVQIAADLERGHVFTDRILHLRGRQETLLLGSDIMRNVLLRLLPGIHLMERPRLSKLEYAGSKKLSRLKRRSAVVCFSAEEVYAVAEFIRRQKGGAAVVLGALSPRTRNAQVELYQNGDVDYLVATDAIGMGLNLDVEHVAFAQDHKFDGFQYRRLTVAEIGQIAGRAGRHLKDGTFGVTGHAEPLNDETIERLEAHVFDPVKILQWRSKNLDFSSLLDLRQSLEITPPLSGLTRALPAVDQRALEFLSRDEEITSLTNDAKSVEILWDICALPDYRRIAPAQHAELIATLYKNLIRKGAVNEDYIARQIGLLDKIDGEIDTLSARIAQIRTWTYVSNHPGWLQNPNHWQEKTRDIENRLSDALHDKLTKRFVDRRTSVLMRRLREKAMLEAEISVNGDMFVEGHPVGQLNGFRFVPDSSAEGLDAKAVMAAAQKALAIEFEARAARLHASGNNDFAIGNDGSIRWMGEPIGRLIKGDHVMRPKLLLLADDQVAENVRDLVTARIERFVNHHIATVLKPLDELSRADDIEGLGRGLAFQLVESLGVLFRRDVHETVKNIEQKDRGVLRRYGIRFGAYHIFLPTLLKPAPAELVSLLWAISNDGFEKAGYGEIIPALAAGRTSLPTDQTFEREFYRLAGFRFLGKRAVRIDILERLADLIRPALSWTPGAAPRPEAGYDGKSFISTPAMLSILGATAEDIEEILKGLGYRSESVTADVAAAHLAGLEANADSADAGPVVEVVAAKQIAKPEEPVTEQASTTDTSDEPKSDVETPIVAGDTEEEAPKPVLLWKPMGRQDRSRGKPNANSAPRNNRNQNKFFKGTGKDGGKDDRKDGDKPGKHHNNKGKRPGTDNRPPRKEKPLDPDSPFAKLAALKAQMK
jgi:ATP-dependent RNA helicase SUPV3L1/SUV3